MVGDLFKVPCRDFQVLFGNRDITGEPVQLCDNVFYSCFRNIGTSAITTASTEPTFANAFRPTRYSNYGNIEFCVYPLGHDFLHIDLSRSLPG